MKTIYTQGKELHIVEVPEKAYMIEVLCDYLFYITHPHQKVENDIQLDGSGYLIKGEVTNDKVGFDCEGYVHFSNGEYFWNYFVNDFSCINVAESFMTIIDFRGITIPEGKKLIVLEKI